MTRSSSAGLLLYRIRGEVVEVLLVHPGGPYWRGKDAGAWSIPKGEVEEGADPLATAQREFREETGSPASGEFVALTPLRQSRGKLVHAWAVRGDLDAASIASNTFSLEWPPRSGRQQQFPEVDRAAWYTIAEAKEKILRGQRGFLDELQERLASGEDRARSKP
jgi:predicted NUDIX family NTP pyrophosphohydrolase